MSKRRDIRNRSMGSINNMSLDDRKLRNSSIFGAETIKSKYIPATKHTISDLQTDVAQYRKDHVFNKYKNHLNLEIFLSFGNLLTRMIHLSCLSCLR